jgi:hypothetical protein
MKSYWKDWISSLTGSQREEISHKLAHEPIDLETMPEWFHPGQKKAWECERRFVLVLAGTQSGKTVAGVWLLLREIQRTARPGEANDYLIVGPDTELLKKKALPEFAKKVKKYAQYRSSDKCFVFTPEGSQKIAGCECEIKVFVGYGHDPDSLEAATYKAVWADEAGQAHFLRESWEALRRRTAIYRARIFMTTTPYKATGWLRDLHDDAVAGRTNDVGIVSFRSIDNPVFVLDEWEQMKRQLPDWKFRSFYEGVFTRPAGAVFDCFDPLTNVVQPFRIPAHWPRHVGVDFGENNTAAAMVAEDPQTLDLYVYETYHAGGRTVEEHVRALNRKLGGELSFGVGGSWGEDEWRRDYVAAGLHLARPAVREVEVGIQRVYKQVKEGRLKVFASCEKLIGEIESYSRELDDRGEPLDAIHDKAKYHRLDALRYIVSALRASATPEVTQYSRLGLPRPGLV